MKHKHCDIIIAWANGEEIQYYDTYTHEGIWRDVANRDLNWYPEIEYRIKPKQEFLKYKVALFKTINSGFLVLAQEPFMYDNVENSDTFVMWLGEEQTVNVGWLQK